MRVQATTTHKITIADNDLYALLDQYVPTLEERAVLAITSKIVALTQGRVVRIGDIEKAALIAQEAEYYLPAEANRYHVTLTITGGRLIPTAGIDESNGNGYYILWPHDPQQVANDVCAHLRERFARQQVGVLITDSTSAPLRLGVTGVALAHSGFHALNSYVGVPDVFGRPLRMTKANVADALATAAVLVMGEGNEQTPLAVLSDLPFVTFQDANPTTEELQSLRIALEDDLYAPLLQAVHWEKGERS